MRWWLAVLFLATGCNRIFSLDETYPIDARPDAVGCSGAVFAGPDPIPGFEGGDAEFDSQLRFDGLELWFSKTSGGDLQTHVARRSNANAPFGPPQLASFDGTDRDYDPALSGDGLRLVFITNRNGVNELFEVTRDSVATEFGAPGAAPAPDIGTEIDSIDLSDDGLRLYYANGDGDLWTAKRPSFIEPFAEATQLLTAAAVFPTLSPDERELFYSPALGSSELWRAVRPDRDVAFDLTTAVRLRDVGPDPDMAGDGTTLTISINNGISVMTRPCL